MREINLLAFWCGVGHRPVLTCMLGGFRVDFTAAARVALVAGVQRGAFVAAMLPKCHRSDETGKYHHRKYDYYQILHGILLDVKPITTIMA